jgi:predicted metal-dependent HD superfamily phosphohydrolase
MGRRMLPHLEAAYAEPHRRYHTRRHVEDCLDKLASVEGLSERDRRVLERAIWWHDAVYDPMRGDNEDKSAELAERDLPGLRTPPGETAEVARLIRLTKGHEVEPGDRLGAILVTIDLSILGAPPADYDAYARAIREEYAHVPDDAFRAGRAQILRRFLDGPIYPLPDLMPGLEARARDNLRREIALLDGEEPRGAAPG